MSNMTFSLLFTNSVDIAAYIGPDETAENVKTKLLKNIKTYSGLHSGIIWRKEFSNIHTILTIFRLWMKKMRMKSNFMPKYIFMIHPHCLLFQNREMADHLPNLLLSIQCCQYNSFSSTVIFFLFLQCFLPIKRLTFFSLYHTMLTLNDLGKIRDQTAQIICFEDAHLKKPCMVRFIFRK